ncbi:MAG: sugar phosphate isomerase/epimerase family protein [Bryobacteraceae bacterium]
MKFGVNTFIWTASFGPEQLPLLPRIKEAGFDGVEVPLFTAKDFDASTIRQGAESNGLECTVCSVLVGGLSLISEDAAIRAKSRAHLKDAVKAVAEAGARTIAGPLYSPVGYLPGRRRNENEWNWCIEAYHELGPTLDACGVNVAIEPLNRFETYFLNTAADAVRLVEAIAHPRVGILFDTFHANIEEKNIAAAYRLVGKHLKHVHTCENDRGTPGSGHVDWPGVFAALKDVGYDGWLTIESFGFSLGELSAAASIWRDLAPTPDVIAFEGVKFLKRNVRAV